ncbi:unnamed protein product [Rotaria sp. Silwood2]|nr:unnamed protein product [Rotaria sp. Silwood2]
MTSCTQNQNPFLHANIWSRCFHSWIAHLLTKNHKHGTLHLTDLYDLLPEFESTKLTDKLEANWFDEIKQYPQEPSLIRATLRTMGWKPLLVGCLLIPTVAPLEITLVIIFFWKFVKYIAFVAVGYTLILQFIRAIFGRFIGSLITKILQATDERVKIMYEIIKSIRIVKMSCWESTFDNKIRRVRKCEIIQCAIRLLIDCFQLFFSHTYIAVTLLMMYATMWSLNIRFDTRFFALATCMLSYMRLSVIDFFNLAVRSLAQYMAAKQRIQDGPFSLKNITFNARPGDLICIIGPVGAGKVEYDHKLFQRVIHATALDSDFAQLPYGANTLVGDQGVMLSGGQKARVNLARALYRDADIYLLDDPLSAVDVKVSKHLFEKSIKSCLGHNICFLATHQVQFLRYATTIIILDNMGTYAQLLDSSSLFASLLKETHQQQQNQSANLEKQSSIEDSNLIEKQDTETISSLPPTNIERKQEGTIKWRVYVSYLQASVSLPIALLLIVLLFFAQQTTALFSTWWLAKLNDDESYRYQIFKNCTTMNIHKSNTMRMFRRLIRCSISFFDMNPFGRILNHFAKDVAIMDDTLPLTFFEFLYYCFLVLGIVTLVCWLNPWSLMPAVMAGSVMILLRNCFSRCSRDLKRLESLTRSPIYSHLTSTIQGLKVIRSYRAEAMCLAEFHSHLDNNIRAEYLHTTVNQWATIRFDWIALIFITCITFLVVIVRIAQYHFTVADIALTLSFSLNLTGLLQWMIRQSVEVETQMTAVERVLEYCSLEQEPFTQVSFNCCPPINWPSHGRIIFDNVSMSHSTDEHSPLVLQNISMTIDAGEKVGIVGRTGAGKTSFIQTLFRIGTLINGRIIIDNIDIASVGLNDVRHRISIIPQDPVLFIGTIRSNLDPFDRYSDTEIWRALEEVII